MKINLAYSYAVLSKLPFRVKTKMRGQTFAGASEFSYEGAKTDLLKQLRAVLIVDRAKVALPPDEELETDEIG